MKRLLIILVCFGVLAACASATPEQRDAFRAFLAEMVKRGELTVAQSESLYKAYIGEFGGIWSSLWGWITDNVPAILTTLLVVLGWRGPIKNRKGLPPTG